MAVYRHIHIDYWQDGFVLDLTPEEKYFYIYLMTNSKTSQSGIYELPKRIIETETGYNRETVEKLIDRFVGYKKIVYCEDTKEVFLKNWIKHNNISSPKVKRCVEKELSNIKSRYLIELFLKECDRYGYSIDRVSIPISEVELSFKNHYGEKEKEKQKEKYKEKEKEKSKSLDSMYVGNLKKFKSLYEKNVGLINSIVESWLIEICDNVDYELFKRAIEIATDKGKLRKDYINGILKQWNDNNIKSISDLKSLEKKSRGDSYGRYENEHTKSKYANVFENEDEGLYRKPSDEEVRELKRELENLK